MRLNPKKREYRLPKHVVGVHRVSVVIRGCHYVLHQISYHEMNCAFSLGHKDVVPANYCFHKDSIILDAFPRKAWLMKIEALTMEVL